MMKRLIFLLVTCFACVAANNLQGEEVGVDISVRGLFKDAAMLEIDGEQVMLRVGESAGRGITLVSADSREAVIDLNGKQVTLNLSTHIGTQFEAPEARIVTISRDELGQYRTVGSINEVPVTFLVDTGANIVALNSNHARSLGLDYQEGTPTQATTAGGIIQSWAVTLGTVQVGDIRINNVRAAVLQGNFPQEILLGMSFLSNVEIQEATEVLVLKGKL